MNECLNSYIDKVTICIDQHFERATEFIAQNPENAQDKMEILEEEIAACRKHLSKNVNTIVDYIERVKGGQEDRTPLKYAVLVQLQKMREVKLPNLTLIGCF